MLLILSCLLGAFFTTVSASCDACIGGICQKKIIVLEGFEQIGQIAIDRTSNVFYFHVKDSKRKYYTCAYDLDNVILNRIWDVNFSFARAVDQNTRDLYVSQEANVYKVNPKDNFTDGVTVFNRTVWHMQFTDKLYYAEFGSTNGIKIFENGKHTDINALTNYKVDDFIIDKNNDIYFSHAFAVYRLRNGQSEAKLFADEIYSLTTDKFGEAYFIQPFNRAIYKLDYNTDMMVNIGALGAGTPYKAVFTSDNYMIYSDIEFNGMYFLVPETNNPHCKVEDQRSGNTVTKTISLDIDML